jgi:hypothetical protein
MADNDQEAIWEEYYTTVPRTKEQQVRRAQIDKGMLAFYDKAVKKLASLHNWEPKDWAAINAMNEEYEYEYEGEYGDSRYVAVAGLTKNEVAVIGSVSQSKKFEECTGQELACISLTKTLGMWLYGPEVEWNGREFEDHSEAMPMPNRKKK